MANVRRPRGTGRHDEDRKRGSSELDEVESIVAKTKRELSALKNDNDRLRAEKNRLHAELRRERDARERLTKRVKTALDNACVEVLGAPAVTDADVTEPGEEEVHGEDDAAPTLPEDMNGPGDAAATPEREEAVDKEEQAIQQAAHSTRPEMPPIAFGAP